MQIPAEANRLLAVVFGEAGIYTATAVQRNEAQRN